MDFFGEIIALTTVLCWTVSVQLFEAASKRVGSVAVNIIRIGTALLFFSILLYLREGTLVPPGFSCSSWLYLGLSGVLGFFIGDIFLFKALVELGPRVTMLVQSLTAPVAALIGWIFLRENYFFLQWFGMFVTLCGISLVILERTAGVVAARKLKVRRVSLRGVLWALVAMVGQASGLVLSKVGMHQDTGYLDPFSATQIRALAAFFCFFVLFTISGRWTFLRTAARDTKAVMLTVAGAAVGPFLGVSLSLWTLHFLEAGIASTFFSLIPVCIIPFSIYLHKEHVSARAAIGAFVAVFGVFMLTRW